MTIVIKFKNKDMFIIIKRPINNNILSKLYIKYSNMYKNINIIINSSIINFKLIHNRYSNFTIIYSFNNIKYSQLLKIKKIMDKYKNIYFTIDNKLYKFNNFNELDKCIKWDLYFEDYCLTI
jgi:hypothetical protein